MPLTVNTNRTGPVLHLSHGLPPARVLYLSFKIKTRSARLGERRMHGAKTSAFSEDKRFVQPEDKDISDGLGSFMLLFTET